MRFAVISDVHSNLYALETVLADIQERKMDFILCTGDLVGYAPFPNEVISLMKRHGVLSIKGNYDHAIGHFEESCGCGFTDPCLLDLAARSVGYTNSVVSEETRRYLRNLPDQLRLKVGRFDIVVVHGSPRVINEPLIENSKELVEVLREMTENVLIFGHTHMPFYQEIDGKHAINSGSVGKPAGQDSRASYAIVCIEDEEIEVEILHIEYPVEKAAQAIFDNPALPNDFGNVLFRGDMSRQADQ